jgi:hypothetical protein
MELYTSLGDGYKAQVSRVIRRQGHPAMIHGMLIDESQKQREPISFEINCVGELSDSQVVGNFLESFENAVNNGEPVFTLEYA